MDSTDPAPRRRFQFRLRTLMIGVTLLAVPYLRRMAGEDREGAEGDARVVKGSRRLLMDVAEAVAPLWESLLERLRRWTLPTRWPTPRGPACRSWTPPPRHAFLREVLRL